MRTLLLTTLLFFCDLVVAEDLVRPIAIHPLAENRVVTANRDGSLSIVDLHTSKVVAVSKIGKQLSDLISLNEADLFLATDEGKHSVSLLKLHGNEFAAIANVSVAPYPVSVRATKDGRFATVTSLWSRRLSILAVDAESSKLSVKQVIDLPFAPRFQQILPGEKQVAVFDAFGGRLAVVDLDTGKIATQRQFPGHAVRGLTMSPEGDSLVTAHQMLNPFAHVNPNDIHWGLLMTNDLRWIKLDAMLDSERQLYSGGRVHPLGIPGRGGADPTAVAVAPSGTIIACLGGVDQVHVILDDRHSFEPVKVGRRPSAVTITRDGKNAVVANTFGDSLSVIRLEDAEVTATIPLGEPRTKSLVEQGEELFYDARFSHEGWMSCHSCHTDGHSNFDRNDNLSDGGFGAPKLVMSLLGRKETAPFAWNAETKTLDEQIRNSIHKTMQFDRPKLADEEVLALAAYVESLPSPPSVDVLRGTVDDKAIKRGKALFASHDCARCHAGKSFTSEAVEDVSLPDELGRRKFNPPSLRGVSQRDAFFHDGRAKSLEEVFLKHRHPNKQEWSEKDAQDLVAYLRSL